MTPFRITNMKILFLCTGNSCRSQMAEGFARHLGQGKIEAFSAGTEPAERVHPLAIQVMAEKGIDISTHQPKSVDEFLSQPLDAVITVCGDAQEQCPAFPGPVQREHWPLPDPARATGTAEEVLEVFRKVRDEIQARVAQWLRERG